MPPNFEKPLRRPARALLVLRMSDLTMDEALTIEKLLAARRRVMKLQQALAQAKAETATPERARDEIEQIESLLAEHLAELDRLSADLE